MGLSASQGRLLLLTARKSDLEFQAQQISQQRLVLSQQLEEISTDYEAATSNRQMKIGLYGTMDGGKSYESVFRNLTYKALVSGTTSQGNLNNRMGIIADPNSEQLSFVSNSCYRLVNADGAIVVASEKEIPESYSISETRSDEIPYDSALTTAYNKQNGVGSLTYGSVKDGDNTKEVIKFEYKETVKEDAGKTYNGKKYEKGDEIVHTEFYDTTGKLVSTTGDTFKSDEKKSITATSEGSAFKLALTYLFEDTSNTNREKLSDNMYRIGGQVYIVDPALNTGGTDPHGATTGPNYLQDCLRNGKYLIQLGSADNDEKKFMWRSVSWDGTSNINDNYYTEDDDKAKARYDRLQSQIQSQDKKLELELDNIETQRSAVTTETESVQKVIDDNVKDSFKVFNA